MSKKTKKTRKSKRTVAAKIRTRLKSLIRKVFGSQSTAVHCKKTTTTVTISRTRPFGIANEGNTCYMASCLQCIFALFPRVLGTPAGTENTLMNALREYYSYPSSLAKIRSFFPPEFQTALQHDISEFFLLMLEKLEQQGGNGKSIANQFDCIVKQRYLDSNKLHHHKTLQVAINNSDTIQEAVDICFKPTVQEETMVPITVQLVIPSPVLALYVMRYDNSRTKINKHLEFTEYLQVCDFVYILSSIVVHEGTLSSGHYISFVKAPDGYWYKCNDYEVTRVSLETVLEQKPVFMIYELK